jgi:glycosyltransferase involved in cell wall biosynthesis
MNILIGCLFFRGYTGSELYVYELAKHLSALKCRVTIVTAETSPEMEFRVQKFGVKVIKPHLLKGKDFDIIHCQHQPVIDMLLKVYPTTPKIATIHSEIIKYEEPIIHTSIKKYVAIRPTIVNLLKNKGINEDSIRLIYNPVDHKRFKKSDVKDDGSVLFVGSPDHLRMNMLDDLIETTRKEGQVLRIVGKLNPIEFAKYGAIKHIKIHAPTWDIENYTMQCDRTAGILLGRTTIEGWLCGKTGWVYDVDNEGKIKGKDLLMPPSDERMEKFHSEKVCLTIFELLKQQYENLI